MATTTDPRDKALRTCMRALKFYANPESYFAIAVWADPPCGGFAKDYSDTGTDLGVRHGKRARKALADVKKILGK